MEVIDNLSLKSGENIELIKVGGDKTNKTILIIGVFHGEEPQGAMAIEKYLREDDLSKTTKNHIYFLTFYPSSSPLHIISYIHIFWKHSLN